MKQIEYIAIEVLLKLIGGMIFLLRKMRGLTDKLMSRYEKRVLKDEENKKIAEKTDSEADEIFCERGRTDFVN